MLPKFTDGQKTVCAAQITATSEITHTNGALKIVMGEKEANLAPYFVQLHSPKIGDWFVVEPDSSGASIMADESFKARFKESE